MKSVRTAVLAALSGAAASVASAQSITTLFATNNSGSAGGMVYFDVIVGSTALQVTELDLNTLAAAGTEFGCQVYTHNGTFSGTETNAGAWTLAATGTGLAAGTDLHSFVTLSNGILLSPGTHAFAISLAPQGSGVAAAHAYTNGTGSNQNFSNADVALSLGSASNVPFTTVFTPRVWNGTLYYGLAGACCLGDGSCSAMAPSTCASQNGIYRGAGVTCANANCACNTLNNGGFESGSLSGWTQFGNTGFTGVATSPVHSGLEAGFFGPVGSTGGISQVVPVAAGTPVVVDFWYQSQGNGPSSFAVDLGNLHLVAFVNDTSHGTWTEFSIPAEAPVNNPVLSFTFRNDPSFTYLDDIRVCAGQAGCYANCDHSTTAPVLNVLDFSCFLNKFAAGCT